MTKDNKQQKLPGSTDTAIAYSTCYAQPNICLYNGDNLDFMSKIEDGSIDVILTDPPYLYLKGQKLEREFDEFVFFNQCKRVLKNQGFIILFGRGTSFYRWNCILADLGFNFKEEVIWDKSQASSPLMSMSRVHETISIHCLGKGKINKVKVPYLEMKSHDIPSIIQDIKRLKSVFTQPNSLDAVNEFLANNHLGFDQNHTIKHKIQVEGHTKGRDRNIDVVNSIKNGMNEKSIIRTDRVDCENFTKHSITSDKRKTGDRCVNVVQSVEFGFNEKTIIKQVREHYTSIHPTQKPVRLLERLLMLVKKTDNDIVLDPFGGSFSTMEAVHNMGMQGIACEIDEEYFEAGKERIEKLQPRQTELFD